MKTLTSVLVGLALLLIVGSSSDAANRQIYWRNAVTTHNAALITTSSASTGGTVYTSDGQDVGFWINVTLSTGASVNVRFDILASPDGTNYSRPATGSTSTITIPGQHWVAYQGPVCHSVKPKFTELGNGSITVTCKAVTQ